MRACLHVFQKAPSFGRAGGFFFNRYLLLEQVFCLFVHPVFYEPVFVLGHKIVVWTCLEPQTAKVSIGCAAGMKAVCFNHCQNGRGGVFCVHVCMCMYMWEEEVAGGCLMTFPVFVVDLTLSLSLKSNVWPWLQLPWWDWFGYQFIICRVYQFESKHTSISMKPKIKHCLSLVLDVSVFTLCCKSETERGPERSCRINTQGS